MFIHLWKTIKERRQISSVNDVFRFLLNMHWLSWIKWNHCINAPNPWKYQTRQQQQICGRKGGRGWSARVANGILQHDTVQVVGNERTYPIRTLSRNNNTTTRLKRGPNPLSGVLIPRPWEVVILSLLSMSPSSPQATEYKLVGTTASKESTRCLKSTRNNKQKKKTRKINKFELLFILVIMTGSLILVL